MAQMVQLFNVNSFSLQSSALNGATVKLISQFRVDEFYYVTESLYCHHLNFVKVAQPSLRHKVDFRPRHVS
jgi:hypothetical protein